AGSGPTFRSVAAGSVIVLGGGVAGLAAAAALAARGVDVRVVEARGRLGGRVHTTRPSGVHLPIELGAEFVHGEAPEVVEICENAGLPLVELSGASAEDPLAAVQGPVAEQVGARGDRGFAQALAEAKVGEPERSRALAYVAGFHAAHPERISARS